MNQNTVSVKLDSQSLMSLKRHLNELGWIDADLSNPYVSWRMRSSKGSVCTAYTSMKVVLQGSEDFNSILSSVQKDTPSNEERVNHLGVDEVGKGDYFGPLVVVSCFLDGDFKKTVLRLGVGDSKKISDGNIKKMYEVLKPYDKFYTSIVYPEEYNSMNEEFKNVAVLLAKQHSKVIEMGLYDLQKKGIECPRVVIDKFSSKDSRVSNELGELGKKIDLVQFHKGESDLAVASASVIARAIFLEEMKKMGEKYGFDFPKGASNVIDSGKEFVRRFGKEELRKVAKIGFRTTKQIL